MRSLIAAIIVASAAGAAEASTITVSGFDAFGLSETNFTDSLDLPRFGDLAPGVSFSRVTGVTLTLTQSVSGTYEAMSRSTTQNTTINGTGPGGAYVDVASTLVSDGTGALAPLALNLEPGSFGTILLVRGTTRMIPFAASQTVSFALGPIASLSGSGLFSLIFDNISDFTDRFTGGNALTGGVVEVGLTGRIDYTYEDVAQVPLPATLPLLLAGLGGLGFLSQRKRVLA